MRIRCAHALLSVGMGDDAGMQAVRERVRGLQRPTGERMAWLLKALRKCETQATEGG